MTSPKSAPAMLSEEERNLRAKVREFVAYVDDFARLGGGALKAKYGDDPMLGFENVRRRAHALLARAALESSAP